MDVQGHRGCRGYLPENTLPALADRVAHTLDDKDFR